MKSADLQVFAESLSRMLSAGVPILSALESIAADTKNRRSKKIIEEIAQRISEGKSLTDSFAEKPAVFDPIFQATVKAGEVGGHLDSSLKQISDNLKRENELIDNIKTAAIYPVLVITVLAIVLIIVITFVIPRITTVFARLPISLPLPSRILLIVGSFLNNNLLGVFLFLVTAGVAIFLSFKFKLIKLGFLASLPPVKNLISKIDLVRFSQTLSTLLASGVPIIQSLELCQKIVLTSAISADLGKIKAEVESGKNLADSFKKSKSFPATIAQLVGVGEKSGTLDKSLADIAEYYHTKVITEVRALTSLVEPILLIIVGIVVGMVILAIIGPIYQLIGQLSAR